MADPTHVRVREGDWEYTIRTEQVTEAHRTTEGVELLDKDPFAPNGKPAPPKPVTALGTPAPGSKQERKRATKTSEASSHGVDAGQSSAAPEKEN